MTNARKYLSGDLLVADIPAATHEALEGTGLVEHVQAVADATESTAYHYVDCGDGSVLEVVCVPGGDGPVLVAHDDALPA